MTYTKAANLNVGDYVTLKRRPLSMYQITDRVFLNAVNDSPRTILFTVRLEGGLRGTSQVTHKEIKGTVLDAPAELLP